MKRAYSLGCASIFLSGAALLLPVVTLAQSAGERGISVFSKGSPISPFQRGQEAAPQAQLEFFPRTNSDPFPKLFPEDEVAMIPAGAQIGQEDSAAREAELQKLPPKDRLVQKYGDPQKDAPVLAVENAPKPFKAMMESLQEGQDELAFQYAKQYVRHLRNVEERSTHVMSMVGFAQKREGMIEGDEWKGAPALEEDRALFHKDVEAAKKKGALSESQISAEAQKVMSAQKSQMQVANKAVGYQMVPTLINGGAQ